MSQPNRALAEHTAPQATMNWPGYAAAYAMAPAQYAPGQHYGAVPAQYAITPSLYGAPAQVHGSRRRPGAIIAAAILGFVFGGLDLLAALLYGLVMVAFSAGHSGRVAGLFVAIACAVALLLLAEGALFIWGGVRALKGRKAMLTIVSSIRVALTLLALFANLASADATSGTVAPTLLGLVIVVPILILLAQRSSKEFSRR